VASVTIHGGLGNVEVRLRLTPTYELRGIKIIQLIW